MKSTESKEMYLETILKLSERGQRVKSVDVANELGFSRPSVSVAVKTLEENDFVEVRENGELVLTQKGNETARKIYERHLVLTEFLMKVGADRGVAEENACRIEHVITDDMFELIKKSV
ncbi:MAG: metal-dependent transcriptional regulator [Clostridia bacterium]|nr:metal-dependent transcriptional regulator [Clostridia bacterium]